MKVTIVNKSDSTGGAAVVSFRLMEALRAEGIDARMLVAEKLTDSPYVAVAAPALVLKRAFLMERLGIFIANGFDRKTLFQIDTAADGVNVAAHPWIKEADVICLNWVNQGLLSFRGMRKLAALGKPIVWTMHDMWNMTGICHHAGTCNHFFRECGECPLMGGRAGEHNLSHEVWKKKKSLYALMRPDGKKCAFSFVAVSNWLASRAADSSLLGGAEPSVTVIPNAFPFPDALPARREHDGIRLLFGAARLDDPVKGIGILAEASHILKNSYPELAAKMELVTFGGVKDPDTLTHFAIPARHLGLIRGADKVRGIYADCDIVVSPSLYETLPGTLVEGQAYGCIPVSFDRGGQRDIVDDGDTGFIAEFTDEPGVSAQHLAEALVRAAESHVKDAAIRERMFATARGRFGAHAVASQYIELFQKLL